MFNSYGSLSPLVGSYLVQFETNVFEKRTLSRIQKYLKCFRTATSIPTTVRSGFNTSINNNETCELCNDYSISVFAKCQMDTVICLAPENLNRLNMNQSEFNNNLKQSDVNESAGHINFGNLILKSCHETVSKSLNLIFQTRLNKGTFPDTCKNCQVAPVFKEGKEADASCYRPIILLCCCSKKLEKAIFDAIYNHTKDTLHEITKANPNSENEGQWVFNFCCFSTRSMTTMTS